MFKNVSNDRTVDFCDSANYRNPVKIIPSFSLSRRISVGCLTNAITSLLFDNQFDRIILF